ncbi:hypothetical protein VB151_20540, partial [Xanthomonas fragariae]|nr:hypothetical protein [Xanthomonas fragariae]
DGVGASTFIALAGHPGRWRSAGIAGAADCRFALPQTRLRPVRGKARQAYQFGVKVGIAVTACKGLVVGARSFPGNPYDGDTLAEQLEQTRG